MKGPWVITVEKREVGENNNGIHVSITVLFTGVCQIYEAATSSNFIPKGPIH